MQTAPVVTYQQPYVVGPVVAPIRTVSVKATRGLGISQIIFGALCCIFGALDFALFKKYCWVSRYGFAVWGGFWIIIGGIIGVCSAAHPSHSGLIGTNLGFAIVSSCISLLNVIVYPIVLSNPANKFSSNDDISPAVGIKCTLVLLMAAELGFSITAAYYCCKDSCSSYQPDAPAIIVQTSQPQTQGFQSYGISAANQPIGFQGCWMQSQPMQWPQGYSKPVYVQTSQPAAMIYSQDNPPIYMQQLPMQPQAMEEPPVYALK